MCDSVDLLGQRCLFQVLQQIAVRLLTLKNTLQAKGENIALSRGHKKKTAALQKSKKTPKSVRYCTDSLFNRTIITQLQLFLSFQPF